MVNQTSSVTDQNKRKEKKILWQKPVYFFIGFIIISTIIAFILGGYFIGNEKAEQEKKDASTTIEEQIDLDLVDLPGNPNNWTSYKFDSLNLEIKLPEELNKNGDWKITKLNGNEGTIICFSDQELNDGNECLGNILIIGAASNNFSSDRDFYFTDSQGFINDNGIYSVKGLSNNNYDLTGVTIKPFDNNSEFEIIKILGANMQGAPSEDYLGAIVNTNNPNYPGLTFQMKINSVISEYEFDQILESLKYSN